MTLKLTILGQPASKANRRRNVLIDGVRRSVKSAEALNYVRGAIPQIAAQVRRARHVPWDQPVEVSIVIHYRDRRSDVDEALILDVMQRLVYTNDRLVDVKHVYRGVPDRKNPRAEIEVREL